MKTKTKNLAAQELARKSWQARLKKYGKKGAMEFLNRKNPKKNKEIKVVEK